MSELLDNEAVRALLPHRYPLLLVDKVHDMVPGIRAIGQKNVTINEPFFPGHFPTMAVMPGVLIIEHMAQVVGVMMLCCPQYNGKIPIIAQIESARFYRPVVPGDVLLTEAETIWVRGLLGKVSMTSRVDGTIVAKCTMKFALKGDASTSGNQSELDADGKDE